MTRGLALAAALWCSRAWADVHPRVELDVTGCREAAEIRRCGRVELGDLMTEGADTERTLATITCDGPRANLRVDDPVTHRSLSRTLDLGAATDAARPRLIALALVELVSASWTELAPAPPTAAIDPPVSPPTQLRVHAEVAPVPVRAMVLVGGLRFSAASQLLTGLVVRIPDRSSSRLGWMIDAEVHRGSQQTELGEVATELLAIGAAAELHVSAGRSRVDLGAGLRGGVVRLSGDAGTMMVEASSFWSRWFGPFLLVDTALPLTDRIALDAAIETGYVLAPVSGLVGTRREAAVAGTWLQLHFGVSVRL